MRCGPDSEVRPRAAGCCAPREPRTVVPRVVAPTSTAHPDGNGSGAPSRDRGGGAARHVAGGRRQATAPRPLRETLVAILLALAAAPLNPAQAAGSAAVPGGDVARTPAEVTGNSGTRHATIAGSRRATMHNLVANGGFAEQPNPLAFWTNAPGAFVTWVSEGANGSQGAAHLRFLPPVSRGVAARGAVYYTGLTQCVAIPRSGRYLLSGVARVSAAASPSSIAGLGWTLRFNGANCLGTVDSSGQVGFSRSTAWSSSVDSIEIDVENWTAATTIEVGVQVGDSSTASIEPVEALVDGIALIEGPLFADGFEP
jgi:hypothetical protein